jgi:ATP-binding cassette subfamily B multidrug efflux pump
LFRAFERLLQPYPEAEPALPPTGFLAFVSACTIGLRSYIALLAVLSAAISAYEAFLFGLLGKIVDWLSQVRPDRLWQEQGTMLTVLAVVLIASTLLVVLQTILKHQTLAINFPLRLRWNFHRLMLGQSLAFYSDDFAGRIAR